MNDITPELSKLQGEFRFELGKVQVDVRTAKQQILQFETERFPALRDAMVNELHRLIGPAVQDSKTARSLNAETRGEMAHFGDEVQSLSDRMDAIEKRLDKLLAVATGEDVPAPEKKRNKIFG